MLSNSQRKLADQLFDIDAVTFGSFPANEHTGNSNRQFSPIKINLRASTHPIEPGPVTPEILDAIGDEFDELLHNNKWEFQWFTALPHAGEFGDQIQRITKHLQSRIHLVKERTKDGARKITDIVDDPARPDRFRSGDYVLIVNSVVTRSHVNIEAIHVLENANLHIYALLAVIDYEHGGTQFLRDMGYPVMSVMRIGDMVRHYHATGRISRETYLETMSYLEQTRQAS